MSALPVREFQQRLRQVIAYYAAGVTDGSYERAMDDLTRDCSDGQWEAVCRCLDEVDEWLAETDAATVYQREKALAKREGRQSRYPGVFEQDTDEAAARIEALRREFGMEATA